MQALTREDIISSFAVADRELVDPPALQDVQWTDLDYFSWKDPTGRRGFLVAPWRGKVVGLVLRFSGSSPEARTGMCNLCLGVHHDGGCTMVLVDTWYQPRSSHGIHICRDLDCSLVVRGLKRADSMRETISTGQKVERFQENLDRFIAGLAEKA